MKNNFMKALQGVIRFLFCAYINIYNVGWHFPDIILKMSDGADKSDGSDGSDRSDRSDGSDRSDKSEGSEGSDGADGSDRSDKSDGSDSIRMANLKLQFSCKRTQSQACLSYVECSRKSCQ